MNCAEFQQHLPEIVEGQRQAEHEAHLRHCTACSALVSDLNVIAREARALQGTEEPHPRVWQSIRNEITHIEADLSAIAEQARTLQDSDEPSPRVWNSLEIALRQEGLIRQPQRPAAARPSRSWVTRWLVPVAAAALVAIGLETYQHIQPTQPAQVAVQQKVIPVFHTSKPVSVQDDQDVLDVLATHAPAARAAYENDLRTVNAYIRDAEETAQENPNDEQIQQALMDAYEQKAMVYQMALDRSLP
jgi:hypothetical protein